MEAVSARRTLVKSPPELWAKLSDAAELARYLGEFGEIRITRLEAERTVAWEGEHARGTVELAPSGWGTRVTLNAELEAAVPQPSPELPASAPAPTPQPSADAPDPPLAPTPAPPESKPEPPLPSDPVEPPPAPPQLGFFARRFARGRRELERYEAAMVAWERRELERQEHKRRERKRYESKLRQWEQQERERQEHERLGLERYETELREWERLDNERRELERREREAAAAAPPPATVESPPEAPGPEASTAVLEAALDGLGAAHHRPFSRG